MKKYWIWGVLLAASVDSIAMAAEQKRVDCDKGESLAEAVEHANANTRIEVSGICHEAVTITVSDIALVGKNGSISGAGMPVPRDLLTIKGALNVTIENLTISNGKAGVVITDGGHASIISSRTENHGNNSILVQAHSFVRLVNSQIVKTSNTGTFHTGEGLVVTGGSSAVVTGSLLVEGFTFGIDIINSSSLTLTEAKVRITDNIMGMQVATTSSTFMTDDATHLDASNNQLIGLTVVSGSSLFVFLGDVNVNNNGLDGLSLFTKSSVDFDRSVKLTANNNGRHGILLEDSTINMFTRPPAGAPNIETLNNGANGLLLRLASKFDMSNGAIFTSSQNGKAGLDADNGSVIGLMNASIENNRGAADLSLTFGSRADFVSGNHVGRLFCDASVLSRGQFTCP